MPDTNKPSSTIGLKNLVIAPLESDTEAGAEYGTVVPVAGAIEVTLTPENSDPDVQYADDGEYDVVYPDPEVTFTTRMADIPLDVQQKIFGSTVDSNGVLLRNSNDKPPYFAVGFKSEKADHTFRYVWLYKVRAKPLTENYNTKEGETITRQTPEVEWTAIKRTYDNNYQAVADEGVNGFTAEKANTFLATVYEPVASA